MINRQLFFLGPQSSATIPNTTNCNKLFSQALKRGYLKIK